MAQKYIRVTMPDGSKWDVPALYVARDRAIYYAKKDGDAGTLEYNQTYQEEYDISMSDDSELLDWAANNMNWSDVSDYAVRVETTPPAVDFQEGWMNGDKEVVEH